MKDLITLDNLLTLLVFFAAGLFGQVLHWLKERSEEKKAGIVPAPFFVYFFKEEVEATCASVMMTFTVVLGTLVVYVQSPPTLPGLIVALQACVFSGYAADSKFNTGVTG